MDMTPEIETLIRAVWAGGFRAGYDAGGDHATAFEHGNSSPSPVTSEDAWKEHVQWRRETDTTMRLDIGDADAWASVP